MSGDMDSLDYLQQGFDPSTLTAPNLRSILVKYNITYPSGANKPKLIQLFVENVVPQARKILAARARAKRTSEGIVNADQDSEDDEPPRRRVTRSSSPRKVSTRLTSEGIQHDQISGRTPRRVVPVRTGAKHTRTSDTDEADEQLQRSMRRASAAPRRVTSPRKVTPIEPTIRDESDDAPARTRDTGVFSSENPFQSGSSPASARRNVSDSRRRTVGVPDVRDAVRKKTNDPARRRTDVQQAVANHGIHPPTSETFEIPVSNLEGLRDVDDNGVETNEEFAPEAQLELVEERAQKGEKALAPLRPKKKSSGMSLRGPMLVIFFTVFAGYAAWYRQQKLAVGYCGVGRPATPIISSKIDAAPEWLTILAEPNCEPCPQHAYCYPELETRCDPDFVLKMHPLSLYGLVPLPPTCEPDGEKVKRIQTVANRAIEELRDRKAKFECGEIDAATGAPVSDPEMGIEQVKQEVSKKRRKAMTDEEFEELWNGAIGEVKGRDEVEIKVDSNTNIETLSSNSLALVSASCALRRSFRITLAKYYAHIGILILVIATLTSIYRRIKANRMAEARVPELVALTLDRLATQASLHIRDGDIFPEGWISIGQLRDDVLREEHSIVKREKLWSKVRKVVEMNANVRAGQRESRNGEISRVWEWIGNVIPVQLPEGASAASIKKIKRDRASFGQFGAEGTPVSGTNEDGSKWTESRPIY